MVIDFRRDVWMVALLAALLALGLLLPDWLRFIVQISMATGLVALGVMMQMRAGLVSFGQGFYYCVGGYAAGLAGVRLGWTDAFALVLLAAAAGAGLGVVLGALLSRYREIFFAMLTLALSMILYGLLVKAAALGSTDGFNVPEATYLGFEPSRVAQQDWDYLFSLGVVVLCCLVARAYLASGAGAALDAVRENELRLEYLGASARMVVLIVFVLAAAISSVGGALAAIAIGHVDPQMTNWTTSGAFVFIALLSGRGSVIAPVLGAFALEMLRVHALDLAPNAWQMIMGSVMLMVIIALPGGLWSLVRRS